MHTALTMSKTTSLQNDEKHMKKAVAEIYNLLLKFSQLRKN